MNSSWEYIPLSEAVDICDSLRKPINSKERSNRIEGKHTDELYPYYGATGQVGYIDDYITDGEYVLLGEDGAPFLDAFAHKAYVISGKTWVNNHAHILKAKGDSRFLCYYLNSFNYKDYVSGTTRLKLTQGKMKMIPVPFPARSEQERIVSRIEELFSSLDNAVETLKKTKKQLEVYRQAVLKKAFEGNYTIEWRKSNEVSADFFFHVLELKRREKGNKSKYDLLEKIDLPHIPEEWKWVCIGDIAVKPEYGTSKKSLKEGKIPVLRMGNMKDGSIDWSDLAYSNDEEDNIKYKLHDQDVLFNRTNSSEHVGKTSIFKGDRDAIYAGYIIRINQLPEINAQYLTYFMNSFVAKQYGKRVKTDGVNQSNINGKKLMSYPFPLCARDEQDRIVYEIESRLSMCDSIEQTVNTALNEAEAMRQSILKEAFEGRL